MSFSLLISALTIPEAVRGLVLNKVSDFTGLIFFWSSSKFSLNDELSTLAEMVLHGLGGELDMLDFFLCFFDLLSWLLLSNWFRSKAFPPAPTSSSPSMPPRTAKPELARNQESPEIPLTSSPGFNVKSLKLCAE